MLFAKTRKPTFSCLPLIRSVGPHQHHRFGGSAFTVNSDPSLPLFFSNALMIGVGFHFPILQMKRAYHSIFCQIIEDEPRAITPEAAQSKPPHSKEQKRS